MLLSKKIRGFWLPVPEKPATGTNTLVAEANGATHTIYTVQIPGWYYVDVRGSGGVSPYHGTGGKGGRAQGAVYLFAGTKVLLWGAAIKATGFPAPTEDFGGHGASGYLPNESGGYGGGAASSGGTGYANGGGGAGALFGIDYIPPEIKTNTESAFTMNKEVVAGDYAVNYLYAAFLCGGGGGGSSDEGDNRSGGGGGGAWGNGGTSYWSTNGRAEGPGGEWGAGGNSGRYSSGGSGAWAIINFTTNEFIYGTGGGAAAASGYARLYKIS